MNGCGVPGWYRSLDTVHKDRGERFIEAAPLTEGNGEVELDRWKAKHPRVFVEVLKERLWFLEVGAVLIR